MVLFLCSSVKDVLTSLCPLVLVSMSSNASTDGSVTRSCNANLPVGDLSSISYRLQGYAHHACTYTIATYNSSGTVIASNTISLNRDYNAHDYTINATNAVRLYVSLSFGSGPGGHSGAVTILSVN